MIQTYSDYILVNTSKMIRKEKAIKCVKYVYLNREIECFTADEIGVAEVF